MTFNRVFGTRVQDRKISLNVPDACQLLGVFESNDSGDADLPSLTLTAYSGPSGNNSDLIVGEKITGLDSNAVALVVEKPNTTTLGIVLLNQNEFNIPYGNYTTPKIYQNYISTLNLDTKELYLFSESKKIERFPIFSSNL